MKTGYRTVYLSMILAVTMILPAISQKSAEKDKAYQEILSIVETGNYVFTVRSVNPTGSKTIHPTTTYTFEARDSVFTASLPYFGRSYQASYPGGGPVEFDGPAENLQITPNERKRQVKVSFRIKGESESYDISLMVGHSAFGTLSINPANRQFISYYGMVEAGK